VKIGEKAFCGNSLSYIVLPENHKYSELGWVDGYGNKYMGGDTVRDLCTYYHVPVPYTLTDDDVEVEDGMIKSCSYDFFHRDIIIPDTLDGQAVVRIASSIFGCKGIRSLILPPKLLSIGDYAFQDNRISELDISTCSALTSIGDCAFYYNKLAEVDITSNRSLVYIGRLAFGNIQNGFSLPDNIEYSTLEWVDSKNKAYEAGDTIIDLEVSYHIPIEYILTDEDVIVEDGVIRSCSYNDIHLKVIIPDTLDGQEVISIEDAKTRNNNIPVKEVIRAGLYHSVFNLNIIISKRIRHRP